MMAKNVVTEKVASVVILVMSSGYLTSATIIIGLSGLGGRIRNPVRVKSVPSAKTVSGRVKM